MLSLRRKAALWLTGTLILGLILCLIYFATRNTLSYKSLPLTESNQLVQNPYCGFFHLYGYPLSEKGTEDAKTWCQQMLANDTQSLVLLQINLRNYSNHPISDAALEQLDCIFSAFSAADKQLILRFLYDWDGKALETEPKEISQIFTHMEQIAPVVNAHANHIFSLQGVFTGNCGEMNQTHYGTNEHIQLLMTKLADVIAPEIFLSVRTPSHLRTITGHKVPLTSSESYQGTLASRLGLYNDGMMGNVFDCGTYDDTSFATTTDPTEKGTREEELAFQNQLCRYVPNGGEVIIENPYNDFTTAHKDLATMHVSYLSCDYDANVLNKWKTATYQGSDTDVFNGCNGYDYIESHLGYRYVITDSYIETSTLAFSLSNTGFAPSYRSFATTLHIKNTSTNETKEIPLEVDTRTILPETKDTIISTELPSLPKGTYQISLAMRDPATGLSIHFANTEASPDGSIFCGILTVD